MGDLRHERTLIFIKPSMADTLRFMEVAPLRA